MTIMAAEAAESAGEGAAAASASGRSRAERAARRGASQYGAQAAYVGRNAQLTPGSRGYQPVLLAEFVGAVVIVAMTPIATGGSPNTRLKGGPSPYDTGDLRQLVAVGGVYFVLALFSSGNSGRLSAWLGGLVLITLMLSKMAKHGELTAVFSTVSGSQQKDTGTETT